MRQLLAFRNLLQKRNIKHWQYLIISSLLSFFTAIFWFYYCALININIVVFPLLAALLQGFIAYVFMEEKGEARKVFFSLFFSFFTFFLGKYLFFEHYYDWYLTAYIDKNEINTSLVLFYLKAINIESLQLFVSGISSVFSLSDFFWVAIIILFSLLYLFLPFEETKTQTEQNPRKIFHKRRFE